MNWGEFLLLATGVAISPIPIAAVILILMSRRGLLNGVSFIVGWLVALSFLTGFGALLFQEFLKSEQGSPTLGLSLARIAFGSFMLVLAARFGRRYATRNRLEPRVPTWLQMIDGFGLGKSCLLGLFLATANIKNLPLAMEAALRLSKVGDQPTVFLLGVITFLSIGSIGVVLPVFAAYLGKETATQLLQKSKTWLQHHNALILCILLSLMGLKAIARGVLELLH